MVLKKEKQVSESLFRVIVHLSLGTGKSESAQKQNKRLITGAILKLGVSQKGVAFLANYIISSLVLCLTMPSVK